MNKKKSYLKTDKKNQKVVIKFKKGLMFLI